MISKNGRSPVEPAAIASRVLSARSYKGVTKDRAGLSAWLQSVVHLNPIYASPTQRKTCPLSPRAKPLEELVWEFSIKNIRIKFVGVA